MQIRTGRRGEFFVRPKAYFDRAFDIMIKAGHGHIFVASHNGRPLAAAMIFTFGHKAWYQYGASEAEGRQLMPSYALQFHVMQWGQEHGIRQYDQVGIPDGEELSEDHPMWDLYVAKYGYGGKAVEWVGGCDKPLGRRGRVWKEYAPLYHVFYQHRFKDYLY